MFTKITFSFLLSFWCTLSIFAQCNSGDCQDGTGSKRFSNGGTYTGKFQAGKREGKGRFVYPNGDIVEGNWKNDRLNGLAILSKKNGDAFEGNWKNNSRYGQGKYTWKDGAKYIGEWYSNRRYGKGIMNYANGNVYNGQWVDDTYEGTGSFAWRSGETYVGTWKKDAPQKGIFAFASGTKYAGNWRKRTIKGNAVYTFFSEGHRIVEWTKESIQDIRDEALKEKANPTKEEEAVVSDEPENTDTPKEDTGSNSNKKVTTTSTENKKKEETDDAFSVFEKKYSENFNMIMRELEAQKQFLIERGIKIREEMDNIARRLSSEAFETEEKVHLESYLKSLEDALVENELAFQDARQKTTDVINKMRNTILEQDTKIEVIEAEKEAEQERLRFFSVIATLAIAVSFVLFMIYRKIDTQKGKIEKQNKLIAKKNQDITSSLNYARRIQLAALPANSIIYRAIPESFVLFEPRDIVSGDFYWFKQLEDKIFIAAVDCTGHGVPGAFMSLIGNKLLNEIVVTKGIHEADKILQELHKGVFEGLDQDNNTTQDGMDISLCIIHTYEKELEFAGASHPLFMVQNNELQEIRGDRFHIGGIQKTKSPNFSKRIIPIEQNADQKQTFYLFSDGFRDQFGTEGSKYGKKRFKQFLTSIHQEPLKKQRISLRDEFLNWKGDQKQLDDILVIGFELV